MSPKYVVVIQCEKALNRCSGFHCAHSFYTKTGHFENYEQNTQYMSFSCGGCNGKSVNTKVAHLAQKAMKKEALTPDDFVLHFASCITNENRHSERCIFLEAMKRNALKIGFKNIEYGSYISQKAQQRREEGIYKTYS